MKPSIIIDVYQFDQHNRFTSVVGAQTDANGELLMPPDCVTFKPAQKKGCYYELSEDKTYWIEKKFPTSAKTCVGIVVEHTDNSEWAYQMRSIFRELITPDNKEFRLVQEEGTNNLYIEPIPEPTLDELKDIKLTELSGIASSFEQNVCKAMVIKSSLGFRADADRRTRDNIRGLIDLNLSNVPYRDADNVSHLLTVANLKTLLNEITQNGTNLYTQKWAKEKQISDAKTKADLEKISLDFEMLDFSH